MKESGVSPAAASSGHWGIRVAATRHPGPLLSLLPPAAAPSLAARCPLQALPQPRGAFWPGKELCGPWAQAQQAPTLPRSEPPLLPRFPRAAAHVQVHEACPDPAHGPRGSRRPIAPCPGHPASWGVVPHGPWSGSCPLPGAALEEVGNVTIQPARPTCPLAVVPGTRLGAAAQGQGPGDNRRGDPVHWLDNCMGSIPAFLSFPLPSPAWP